MQCCGSQAPLLSTPPTLVFNILREAGMDMNLLTIINPYRKK